MINRRLLMCGLIGALFVSNSCRDEFSPDIEEYSSHLVVDGMITDEPGPYTVKLSLSAPVDKPDYIPFTNCVVTIHTLEGEAEQLQEVSAGVYKSSSKGIRGQTGHSYRLSVNTPNGKQYQTPFIEMPEAVGIDTVKAELEFRENNDFANPVGGYQFYLSTVPSSQEKYFMWKFEETYEFHSQYKIHFIFNGMGLEPNFNRDTLYICYKTKTIAELYTGTTAGLSINQLVDEPIHYVNTTTKRLQVRYSLLVKQYSIPQKAYHHWKAVQEQVEGDDFLITNQPYQITGNLVNVNNPEEIALGYFTVGAAQKKRFFFDKPDVEFHYATCVAFTELMSLYYIPASQYPVYITTTLEGLAYASDYCFDCTLWNGSLEKPDFWIDKKLKNTDAY